MSTYENDVTPQSALSTALIGKSPYDQAGRILAHLNAIGWTVAKLPRIPEPGWGAIVEAGVEQHDERLLWMPNDRGFWSCKNPNEYARHWQQLLNPALVRDGIEESS